MGTVFKLKSEIHAPSECPCHKQSLNNCSRVSHLDQRVSSRVPRQLDFVHGSNTVSSSVLRGTRLTFEIGCDLKEALVSRSRPVNLMPSAAHSQRCLEGWGQKPIRYCKRRILATLGTPAASMMNSMYMPGGAMFALLGAVKLSVPPSRRAMFNGTRICP